MHVSSFLNDPDRIQRHSNEYAAGSASSQSFAERQAIERHRRMIKAYSQSRLGSPFADRTQSKDTSLRASDTHTVPPTQRSASSLRTRQEINSRPDTNVPHRFVEPPARRYNPYQ